MTGSMSPEEFLKYKWRAQLLEPANRIALTAAQQEKNNVPHKYGAKFDAQAMDVDARHKLIPQSQWEKAIERKGVWPGSWTRSNDKRRTEPMIIDDEDDSTEWSFKIIDRQRASKHKLCETLTESYQEILRETQHRESMAEMGMWWSLYTGDAAEQLMYWFSEGYPLQALTYLAVSRLKSNRALVPGREGDMISNFVWARKENPDGPLRSFSPDQGSTVKRAKTQAEEDSCFIYGEDKKSEIGRRRAGIDSYHKTRLTRLPIGAMTRLRQPVYKLYVEHTTRVGYQKAKVAVGGRKGKDNEKGEKADNGQRPRQLKFALSYR